jgi:hypothetical protein
VPAKEHRACGIGHYRASRPKAIARQFYNNWHKTAGVRAEVVVMLDRLDHHGRRDRHVIHKP